MQNLRVHFIKKTELFYAVLCKVIEKKRKIAEMVYVCKKGFFKKICSWHGALAGVPLARGLARLDLGIKSSTRLVNENRGSCPALLRESSAKCIVRIFFCSLGAPSVAFAVFPVFSKKSLEQKKTNLEDAFQRPRHRVQPRHRPGVGQAACAGGGGGLQVKSSQKHKIVWHRVIRGRPTNLFVTCRRPERAPELATIARGNWFFDSKI